MRTLSKLLLIIATIGLGFNSCEKEKIEVAGEIPGMGNSGGVLEATVYDFHEDLVLSSIVGVGDELKSTSDDEVHIEAVAQGSGDNVVITLTITNNNTSEWRSAYFRAGSVFEVNLEGYQNGILLAPVVVCLSPGEVRTVTLFSFCLNKGKSDSDNSASYKLLGVTQSVPMMELVDALQGKMVNYEHYMIYYGSGASSSYNDVKDMLQEIVWRITNGDGMTQEDRDFISSLPELQQGVLPDGIYDPSFVLPVSWCNTCSLETAWGGTSEGAGKAWWFYYDVSVGGQQAIYAGKKEVDGAYIEYIDGEIRIELGNSLSLIDDDEAVKIEGYNTLPTDRPAAGPFKEYKGTDLTVQVDEFAYYAVHLDVAVCK